MPVFRVIDLIAQLQNHDPVAPVEVWHVAPTLNQGKPDKIKEFGIESVFQANPLVLKSYGVEVDVTKERGPMPVVVKIG